MDKFVVDNGDSVKFEENTWDFERVDNFVARIYATRNQLIQDISLKVGNICKTCGYDRVGDGGDGEYLIVENVTPADDINVILANGLTARLQYGIEINVRQLGIKAGSNSYKMGNASKLAYYIKNYPVVFKYFFPQGQYYFSSVHPDKGSGDLIVNLRGEVCAPQIEYQVTCILTEGENFLYDDSDNNGSCYFELTDLWVRSQNQRGIGFGSKNAGECNFNFTNVYVSGFDYGFYAPHFACGGSGGKNINFSECHYGCYIAQASHLFNIEGLSLNYNRVGLRLGVGGSPCRIKNVHLALGYFFSDKNNFNNFIGIHTKGGLEIDGIYYEDYIGAEGQPEKTIIIDYEYWSYDVEPLRIKNTPVKQPAATGSQFMRFYQYEGAGREVNPMAVPSRYMTDILFFNNCQITRETPLQAIIEFNPNVPQLGICVDGQNEYYGTFEILMNRPRYRIKTENCIAGELHTPTIGTKFRVLKWSSASDISGILIDKSKIINVSMVNNFLQNNNISLSYGFNWCIKYKIFGKNITNGNYQFAWQNSYQTGIPTVQEQVIVNDGALKLEGEIRFLGTDFASTQRNIELGFLGDKLPVMDYQKLSLDLELIQLGPDRFQ